MSCGFFDNLYNSLFSIREWPSDLILWIGTLIGRTTSISDDIRGLDADDIEVANRVLTKNGL